MRSERTWRRRRLRAEEERLCSDQRYVDFGVRIYTVEQDEEEGAVLWPGKPKLVRTRVENFGGVWDTSRLEWHDESPCPIVWYLSGEQRELVLHALEGYSDHLPLRLWCEAAEGAGKTSHVLAPWLVLSCIAFAGQYVTIGAIAPTEDRLEFVRAGVAAKASPEWFTWRKQELDFLSALGPKLQLISAYRQSEAGGSPVQGYDLVRCGQDEGQDQLHVMADVETRGRAAPDGRYKRMITGSVKDTAAYRKFREQWIQQELCGIRRLTARTNPGVAQAYWDNLRHTLSKRDYARRVDALLQGSERATYPDFTEDGNTIVLPRVARDVTHHVAGIYSSYQRAGAVFRMVLGHDPGKVQNTTVFHKAFLFPGRLLTWLVVDEFITHRTTQERHAKALREYIQEKYPGLEADLDKYDDDEGMDKVLVFRDPHGRGEQHPDDDVEGAFRRHEFDIFTAAPDKQVIKRRSRLEMMNRLILSDSGNVRFYLAKNAAGAIAAPETFISFQTQERDEAENPESTEKGEKDITHPAVASGYALWPFENEHVMEWTFERVLKAEVKR